MVWDLTIYTCSNIIFIGKNKRNDMNVFITLSVWCLTMFGWSVQFILFWQSNPLKACQFLLNQIDNITIFVIVICIFFSGQLELMLYCVTDKSVFLHCLCEKSLINRQISIVVITVGERQKTPMHW